jgi:putative FmdB family regulatory protein
MPTYDYSCDACHHEFEVFEPITAPPQKKCPKCKKSKLRRLFGAGAGLIFKGSGFYQTDYRSDSYKKAAEAEKPKTDSAGASSDSSTKTDSTKTDAAPVEAKSNAASKPETKSKKPRA